jgi:hypothetical protein
MARESAQARLGRIPVLAPQVAASPPAGMDAAAPGRAEFRYLVRRLAGAFVRLCRISARAKNDEILAPAQAELSRFRARLEGTSHAAAGHIEPRGAGRRPSPDRPARERDSYRGQLP